jgi:hypothetical protein
MGLYGGGGTTVNYQPPVIEKDNTFQKFLEHEQGKETRAEQRAAAEKKERDDATAARRTRAAQGYSGVRSSIQDQLNLGLITFNDATAQLRDYYSKNDLGALTEGGPNVEQDVADITNKYTKEIRPGRLATGITSAYKEMYGREAKEEEKAAELEKFNQGYYSTVQDLKDSLAKSSEYQEKFETSYLGNYYKTMYGKQATDAAGKKTGQYTFNFDKNLLPSYADTTKARAGVQLPNFADSFTGTPSEIEENLQNVRDTRKYLYSAGLTNLQGEIDKETQKLKNEGAKELAKINQWTGIASNAMSGFWNSIS